MIHSECLIMEVEGVWLNSEWNQIHNTLYLLQASCHPTFNCWLLQINTNLNIKNINLNIENILNINLNNNFTTSVFKMLIHIT